MTAVTVTYIFMADEGFRVPAVPSYAVGGSVSLVLLGLYIFFLVKLRIKGHIPPPTSPTCPRATGLAKWRLPVVWQ